MAILTVDDAPSALFAEKLAWLRKERIPALFFLWGEKAAAAEGPLMEALDAGFLLGNHSWTHPHFSALDEAEARAEITRTDALLAALHRKAGIPWNRKYFRFPYFDRGNSKSEARFQAILAELGYVRADLSFADPGHPEVGANERRDTLCDFDQKEYWLGNADAPESLGEKEAVMARIGPESPAWDDVILIHDHEYSHDLFFDCVRRYRDLGVEFTLP